MCAHKTSNDHGHGQCQALENRLYMTEKCFSGKYLYWTEVCPVNSDNCFMKLWGRHVIINYAYVRGLAGVDFSIRHYKWLTSK